MENLYEKVEESVAYLKAKITKKPTIGIILGSGLGGLVDQFKDKEEILYSDIPNFPLVSVEGHKGSLLVGTIGDKIVLAMQGRFHYYEGYTMKEVTYPIFVMKLLGIEKIVVTNACGGINTDFNPGTLMIINDFINLTANNPLIGHNDERFGPRFPDMSEPYKHYLIDKAKKIADKKNISYKEGVYAHFTGPYYETAAEIRAYGRMGADAIGMSTVPETIVANYLGIDVLGIACITNMATGIQKCKHSHANVVDVANKSSATLCDWVTDIIKEI